MPKIIQSGNSLGVTIPKKFAKIIGAKRGDEVKIKKLPQKAQMIITFNGPKQLVLSNKINES